MNDEDSPQWKISPRSQWEAKNTASPASPRPEVSQRSMKSARTAATGEKVRISLTNPRNPGGLSFDRAGWDPLPVWGRVWAGEVFDV